MSWQKTKISEFLIERKDRFKPDKANELGLPRIEKIDFSGTIYINNFKPTKTGMILVKNGDLVISGINVEKGALAIYKGDTDALATIHYSSYTYDEDKIDIDFLKWYLQSNIFRNILKEQVKGGIKTEIKPKTFLNLEIILPDLITQKQIALKLNKLEWNVKDLDFTCFYNKQIIKDLRQSILEGSLYNKDIKYSNKILQDVIIEKPKNGFSPKPVNYKTAIKVLTLSATTSGKFDSNCYKYVDIEINGILVRLGGMYDYAFGLDGNNTALSAPEDVLAFLEDFQNTDRVKIMLSHRPDSFIFGDASEVWDIDLVISGHNHGGQVVLPFLGGLYGGDQGWFPTYVHGLYEKGNLQLFITSGLGSDRQKLPRFNNPPEVAVLVIE